MKVVASLAVMAFVLAAYYAGGFFGSKTAVIYMNSTDVLSYAQDGVYSGRTARVIVPAVDQDGVGVQTLLVVSIVPGSGRTLVDIDRLIFWADTQDSIRTARDVAQRHLNVNASPYDIIYTIRANASVIEGPSAGAALTVATISALGGRQPNMSVMMTGTITPDGRIGPIGDVIAKANAARQIGAVLFLVPRGQSVETRYVQENRCSRFGASEVCRMENVARRVDVASESGISVAEVTTIGDAVRYFLG